MTYQRIDGFNNPHHPVATTIISGQNRGDSDGAGTAAHNFIPTITAV